jgi:quercetin dioxygenase-like cupin family protein
MALSGLRKHDNQTTSTVLNIFGDLVSIKVAGNETQGQYTVICGETPPLGGPPLHLHTTDAETFYIVEGTFLFELDGEVIHATSGDIVHIQPGVKHLYQNTGADFGKLLLVVAPAGLDEFFIELDSLLKAHAEPPMPEIAALHAKFNMELLGPPMVAR